jgi:predicted RNA-binding protein with TRAM domain
LFIEPKEGVPPEHFEVVARGPLAKLQPESPLEEGQELTVKPVEVGLHDPSVGVAKHDGFDIAVAGGARFVGKRTKVRIARVLDGTAFAELVDGAKPAEPPITAEALAEKPTRARRSRIAKPEEPKAEAVAEGPEAEAVAEGPEAEAVAEEPEAEEPTEEGAAEEVPKPKKRTRRGSRGGRRRKKKPAETTAEAAPAEAAENGQPAEAPVLIHLPDPALGGDEAEPAAEQPAATAGGEAPKPKKKTRRGSRGGRRRRKPAAAKSNGAGTEGKAPAEPEKAAEPLVD